MPMPSLELTSDPPVEGLPVPSGLRAGYALNVDVESSTTNPTISPRCQFHSCRHLSLWERRRWRRPSESYRHRQHLHSPCKTSSSTFRMRCPCRGPRHADHERWRSGGDVRESEKCGAARLLWGFCGRGKEGSFPDDTGVVVNASPTSMGGDGNETRRIHTRSQWCGLT